MATNDRPFNFWCPYPHQREGPAQPDDPPCLCFPGPSSADLVVLFHYEFPELGLAAFLVLFFSLKALGLF